MAPERHFRGSAIRLAVALAVALAIVVPLAAQNREYKAPRLPGTDHPNLNGLWQALNTAYWDIQDHPAQPGPVLALGAWGAIPAGRGVVEGNEIPYQPWALAKKKENFEKRLIVDPFDFTVGDPEHKCYLPGVPRATYLPFPFQIVQSTNTLLFSYEFADASRLINMEKHSAPLSDFWMGWSNGHWQGDTLVITVTGFNGQTWFDRAGNFHSEALRVVERYTPISPDHLQYEATIEDPKVFTRPWKISMPLYRRIEARAQRLEFKCVEFTEELIYGSLRRKASK
jgi:hypothetical protein